MNDVFHAVARESQIAAEQMAIGATALSKANYAHSGYYSQAFFALTTGFERASKLAILIDDAIDHDGTFTISAKELRTYGHDLRKLLNKTDEIAERKHLRREAIGLPPNLIQNADRLPRSNIHDSIIAVLSDFANNLTRYYNLGVAIGHGGAERRDDPVASWWKLVVLPVLAAHYRDSQRRSDEREADLIQRLFEEGGVRVTFFAETGETLDSGYAASLRAAETKVAARWTRMYVLQIARFLGTLLIELGREGRFLETPIVPNLAETFGIFYNDDAFFRSRKTWSIYGR